MALFITFNVPVHVYLFLYSQELVPPGDPGGPSPI